MEDISQQVTTILSAIGEDPNREGLLKTPERVSRAYEFLTGKFPHHLQDTFITNTPSAKLVLDHILSLSGKFILVRTHVSRYYIKQSTFKSKTRTILFLQWVNLLKKLSLCLLTLVYLTHM